MAPSGVDRGARPPVELRQRNAGGRQSLSARGLCKVRGALEPRGNFPKTILVLNPRGTASCRQRCGDPIAAGCNPYELAVNPSQPLDVHPTKGPATQAPVPIGCMAAQYQCAAEADRTPWARQRRDGGGDRILGQDLTGRRCGLLWNLRKTVDVASPAFVARGILWFPTFYRSPRGTRGVVARRAAVGSSLPGGPAVRTGHAIWRART